VRVARGKRSSEDFLDVQDHLLSRGSLPEVGTLLHNGKYDISTIARTYRGRYAWNRNE